MTQPTLMHNTPGHSTSAVDILVQARDHRSVLKMRLISFAPVFAKTMLFAFEGDDDKVVFSQWIRRIAADRNFEPFVCGGKRNSRLLSCILADDVSGLSERVALFVDRDFDDIDRFCQVPWLFWTDRYSIENYLVQEEVLEHILRDFFPLDGEPGIKAAILEKFTSLYDEFLDKSSPANFRLYVANKCGVARRREFNPRLSHIVQFSIDGIAHSEMNLEDVLPLVREPTAEEKELHEPAFGLLESRTRYRGKFAMQFFNSFLKDLCALCRKGDPALFGGVPRPNVREGEICLSTFASASRMPQGFSEFLQGLPS